MEKQKIKCLGGLIDGVVFRKKDGKDKITVNLKL